MKKTGIFILCAILIASMQAFADNCSKDCDNTCPKEVEMCPNNDLNNNNCFLCTNSDMEIVFKETGLSDSQICTARKLQEKYEQETLSVNDRLEYEENVLNEYNATCANKSDIRSQKKKINDLKKTKNDICKCYQKQFKVMLSDAQRKEYKKYSR